MRNFFLTTHSNHFLDITLDYEDKASFYSCEKKEIKAGEKKETKTEIRSITQNKEVLNLMGIRNSSVFLSNCIIWVEGISDRLYIKHFLDLFKKYLEKSSKEELEKQKLNELKIYQEDKHYSILEYGGGNVVHFNFGKNDGNPNTINTDAVSKNNFLVEDNDGHNLQTGNNIKTNKIDKKGNRLLKHQDIFKENFFGKHFEIENILSKDIILKVVK